MAPHGDGKRGANAPESQAMRVRHAIRAATPPTVPPAQPALQPLPPSMLALPEVSAFAAADGRTDEGGGASGEGIGGGSGSCGNGGKLGSSGGGEDGGRSRWCDGGGSCSC